MQFDIKLGNISINRCSAPSATRCSIASSGLIVESVDVFSSEEDEFLSFISCCKSVWNYSDFGSRAPQHCDQFVVGSHKAAAHPLHHVLVKILMDLPVLESIVPARVTAQRSMLRVFWI